jgi:hypothetical protein
MKKQEEMKIDIRRLLNLAISNIGPASAESKRADQSGLESGMAAIGLELASMERQLITLWAAYERSELKPTITYPRQYDLKTNADRVEEANGYKELKGVAPSRTFAKVLSKIAATTLLEGRVDHGTLDKIMSEIDEAKYITGDYKEITADLENGLVTVETASDARGYDGSYETPKAKEEHAARLARITTAQSSGNPDIGNVVKPKDTQIVDPAQRGQQK